ncbi:hypothetical protein NMY22_g2047 [Coprinellus aureogranulatus]|nr:hypothetical protein NMY22_g2047 [Coprinellus aureogranulatus]
MLHSGVNQTLMTPLRTDLPAPRTLACKFSYLTFLESMFHASCLQTPTAPHTTSRLTLPRYPVYMSSRNIPDLFLLATTNTPPRPHDVPTIRQLIDRIDGHAGGLKSQVQNIEAQLEELKQQVALLDRDLELYRPILSPIRRLPPEILPEIFIHLPPSGRLSPVTSYQDVLRALCLVCRAWRRAALSLPHFWSTVRLKLPIADSRLAAGQVITWLNRARDLEKTISFEAKNCAEFHHERERGRGSNYSFSPPPAFGYYEPPRARRCKGSGSCVYADIAVLSILASPQTLQRVFCRFPSSDCFRSFTNLLQSYQGPSGSYFSGSIKFLSLDFQLCETWLQPNQGSVFDAITSGVTTLHLGLPSSAVFQHDSHVHAPISPPSLSNVKVLCLTANISASHIFRLLQFCRALEEVKLEFRRFSDCFSRWGPNDPLMLNASQFGLILPKPEVAQVPQLVNVTIVVDEGGWTPSTAINAAVAPHFSAFLRGDPSFAPKIEHLHLQNVVFEGDILFESLKDLASITHLILDNIVYDDNLFHKLSVPIARLPQLQHLRVLSPQFDIPPETIQAIEGFASGREIDLLISDEMADMTDDEDEEDED